METVKERTERKTGLDYELKIDTLPEELNGKPVTVEVEVEVEVDNYTYTISREELHERIEQARQDERDGGCKPLDGAFIERMKKIEDGVRNGTVKATG